MARKQDSLLRRSFAQVDLAFWCIHEHVGTLFVLALPTVFLMALLASVAAVILRSYELPTIYQVVLYWLVYPTALLWVLTFAPLPCAVFAWHRSAGRVLTPNECLQRLMDHSGRLLRVAVRLGFYYLLWFLFAGLPMFLYWPRTCLAPMVALFEDDRRIFRRARLLLKEDTAVYVLALIHFCLLIAMLTLLFLPRGLIATNLFANPWTLATVEYLWIVELFGAVLVVCGLAVSWCLSLTLLYDHVRQVREGEALRQQIAGLRERYRSSSVAV